MRLEASDITNREEKPTTKHLSKKELLAASKVTGQIIDPHLMTCSECRHAAELLRLFPVSGRLPLPDPPQSWTERAKSIFGGPTVKPLLERLMATVTFDSWLSPVPLGVRGPGVIGERRACFRAGSWIVDLRAEKCRKHWSMVAQLAGEQRVDAETAELIVGKRTFRCDLHGIFQWTSAKPPPKLTIRMGDNLILLPELPWKRRKPR
jgi:hypothetical protein